MLRTAFLRSQMSEMFGRWVGFFSESTPEPEFVFLSGDAAIKVKSQRPTVEIPAGAAFDIRKSLSLKEFEAELGKQIRILRTQNPQSKGEKVAMVFRLREGNVEKLLPELRTAAKVSTLRKSVGDWYVVVDPNVTKEEAVERFNRATGGRGQVKAAVVDAALKRPDSWSSW